MTTRPVRSTRAGVLVRPRTRRDRTPSPKRLQREAPGRPPQVKLRNELEEITEPSDLTRFLGRASIIVTVLIGYGVVFELGFDRPRYRYVAFLLAFSCALTAGRSSLVRIRLILPMTMYIIWSLASLSWTISLADTSYDLRTNALLVFGMMLVASVLPLTDIFRAYATAFQSAIVITAYILITQPSTRLFSQTNVAAYGNLIVSESAWKGGFLSKNDLAIFAAFALVWVLAFSRNGFRRTASLLGLITLIIGSRSVTGLIGAVVGLIIWWSWGMLQARGPRRRATLLVAATPMMLIGALGVAVSLSSVASDFGKNLTLTGRTMIWAQAVQVALHHPVLGLGPSALFGTSGGSQASFGLIQRVGFYFSHAHNAWLEVQLDLGFVGLLLILTLLVCCVTDAIRLFSVAPLISRWLIASVFVMVVMSITELTLTGAGWLSSLAVMRIVALRVRAMERSVSPASHSTAGSQSGDAGQEVAHPPGRLVDRMSVPMVPNGRQPSPVWNGVQATPKVHEPIEIASSRVTPPSLALPIPHRSTLAEPSATFTRDQRQDGDPHHDSDPARRDVDPPPSTVRPYPQQLDPTHGSEETQSDVAVIAVALALLLLLAASGIVLLGGLNHSPDRGVGTKPSAVPNVEPTEATTTTSRIALGPGHAVVVSQHLVFTSAVSRIRLRAREVPIAGAANSFRTRVGNLQLLSGNSAPITIPGSLQAGDAVTVDLPAPSSEFNILYVTYNAVVRTAHASGDVSVLLTPLTLDPHPRMRSSLLIQSPGLTSLLCESPGEAPSSCGARSELGWSLKLHPDQWDVNVIGLLRGQR
jgi:exopolysaccharide production protein ExoQ